MLLTFANERILRSFAVLHFLTASQATRLFYRNGSGRYVNAMLKNLTDQRYLTRQALPSDRRLGSVPYVYALTQRGRTYLTQLGYDFSRRSSASQHFAYGTSFLSHALAVTDFLIAAILLPKYNNSIAVSDIRHDLTLKRLMQGYVVPDGFIDLRLRGTVQQCFLLEVDRGTENKAQIQHKVAGLLQFIQPRPGNQPSLYEQLFATTSLTILSAIVSPTDKRLTDMLRWTDEVLVASGQNREADLFRFAYLPEGPLDPVWLFLTPIWRRLGTPGFVPLLKV